MSKTYDIYYHVTYEHGQIPDLKQRVLDYNNDFFGPTTYYVGGVPDYDALRFNISNFLSGVDFVPVKLLIGKSVCRPPDQYNRKIGNQNAKNNAKEQSLIISRVYIHDNNLEVVVWEPTSKFYKVVLSYARHRDWPEIVSVNF